MEHIITDAQYRNTIPTRSSTRSRGQPERQLCKTHIVVAGLVMRAVHTLIVLFGVVYSVFSARKDGSTKYIEHFIKSIGSLHLNHVYPSQQFVGHAVEHTYARVRDATGPSQHQYTACVAYHDYDVLKEAMDRTTARMHISYSSAEDDIICAYIFATAEVISELQNHPSVTFTMFEPVPTEVKLDGSIHQLQYNYLSPYHSSTSVTRAHAVKADNAVTHPMVLDAISGSDLQLSVMLRPDTDSQVQISLAADWIQHLVPRSTNSSVEAKAVQSTAAADVTHLFWAAPTAHGRILSNLNGVEQQGTENEIRAKIKVGKRSSRAELRQKSAASSKTATMSTSRIPMRALSSAEENILRDRQSAWTVWAKTMRRMRTAGEHVQQCGFDEITVRHQRNNVVLSLPRRMLDFGVMNDANMHVEESTRAGDGDGHGDAEGAGGGVDGGVHAMRARRGRDARRVAGACFAELIALISAEPLVTRVALAKPMQTLNDYARQVTQSGTLGSEPFTTLGLDGTGVVVGISDTGIDETSCYFRDKAHGLVPRSSVAKPTYDAKYRKVIQYITYSGSGGDYAAGHGTHVAGTVAGKCDYESNNDAQNVYRGMASGAKIAFFDVGVNNDRHELRIPDQLGHDVFATAKLAGARIHSNSWGGGYLYDAFTIAADEYLYKNPDFLVVFAAGNSGSSGAYTINSPALSKNALAVACSNTGHTGDVDTIDHIAAFSSHGPTMDGRIKPEITAPGNYLKSALARVEGSTGSSCATTQKSGTSMAAPVVAGSAALIMQYFQDTKYWAKYCNPAYALCSGAFTPSGTLLKALILQSGKPVSAYDGNAGATLSVPDTYQGYGRIDLAAILPMVSHTTAAFTLYMDDERSLAELQETVYSVTVTSSAQPLKVTLSWFDPPNEAFAAKYLLHDLDLVVESPDETLQYLGNAPMSQGRPALGARRDEINNNEQVIVPSPALGAWKVHVQAKRLTQADHQSYSLVITAKASVVVSQIGTSLSPSVLAECASGSGTPSSLPRVSLDVAKYAKLTSSGWSAGDSYSIIQTAGTVVDGDATATTFSGRISAHAYEVDRLCVPAGCYTAVMNVTGPSSKKGAHMGIPECDVFVAPLVPQQDFCVDPAGQFLQSEGEIPVFSDTPCLSSCEKSDHLLLPLYLGEYYEGAGWAGTYYAIQRVVEGNPSSGSVSPLVDNSAGGGTMDWGFEEAVDHCLPLQDGCYWVQLSVAKTVVDKDLEYPVLYLMDTFVPDRPTQDCPYELNVTVTLAKLCVHQSASASLSTTASTTVTYYKQTDAYDLGQALTKWSDFELATRSTRLTAVGTCNGKVSYAPRIAAANKYDTWTDAPTVSPSAVPTTQPTLLPSALPTAAPSQEPTFAPSNSPSAAPTAGPTVATADPTADPSVVPSSDPTMDPTVGPSEVPSTTPTAAPSDAPDISPEGEDNTVAPSTAATTVPSPVPSQVTTHVPTISPTVGPTITSTVTPSPEATQAPTLVPTSDPSASPTAAPSAELTAVPSAVPSEGPSAVPSAQPSTQTDYEWATVYGNHSVACLADCPGFPGAGTFLNDSFETCVFLVDVYHLCTSYSVGYGYCTPPSCAADCSIEDWCYFGSGMVIGCPNGGQWYGGVQDAKDIQAQCVASTIEMKTADPDGDGTGGPASSTPASTIIAIVITVLIAAGAAGVTIYCMCFARKRPYGDLLPTDSTHSESGDALTAYSMRGGGGDSTHGPASGTGASLSSLRAFPGSGDQMEQGEPSRQAARAPQPAQQPQQPQQPQQQRRPPKLINPDKLRSLLARSADFLSSRRHSPKTQGSGGSGTSGQYESVRSPFSIVGDDDEDEGDGGDGYDGSGSSGRDLRV